MNLIMTFEPLWIYWTTLLEAMLFRSKIVILLCKIYNEILSSFNFIYNIMDVDLKACQKIKNKYGGKTFIYNIELVELINDVMNYSNK